MLRIRLVILIFILNLNSYAFNLKDIIDNSGPLIDYDIDIGMLNGNLTCFEDGLGIPNIRSLCKKYTDKADDKLDNIGDKVDELKSKTVELGPCSFNSDKSRSRNSNALERLCREYVSSSAKDVSFNTTDGIIIDDENLSLFGGDAYYKKDNSNPLDVKIGNKTVKEIYNDELSYNKVSKKISNALFSATDYSVYESCVKKALYLKKDPELCKTSNYGLPKNRGRLAENIITAVKKISEDPLNKNFERSYQIRQKLLELNKKCDGQKSQNCEEENFNNLKIAYGNSNVSMAEYRNAQMQIIEENSKAYLNYLNSSNTNKLKLNFPTQDALEHVALKYRAKYISLAKEQISNEILLKSSILKLTNLKKELIDLNFYDLRNNSIPFYQKNALERAKEIMEKGMIEDE